MLGLVPVCNVRPVYLEMQLASNKHNTQAPYSLEFGFQVYVDAMLTKIKHSNIANGKYTCPGLAVLNYINCELLNIMSLTLDIT